MYMSVLVLAKSMIYTWRYSKNFHYDTSIAILLYRLRRNKKRIDHAYKYICIKMIIV